MEGVKAAMKARNLETDQWGNVEEWRLVSIQLVASCHTDYSTRLSDILALKDNPFCTQTFFRVKKVW
jgi:hypothetical protein